MTIDERLFLCDIVVGRDRELGVLTRAIENLPQAGGSVLVAGEAGVGKTRLAREAAALARTRGLTVLSGRAVPTTIPVPYRALTEALVGAFRSTRPAEVPELAGFGGQLSRLVPDWPPARGGGGDESPILLGEAVLRLLRFLGGGSGCVLLLEDLHWADAETLQVVEYLAENLAGETAALCLCTARSEHEVAATAGRLRRLPGARVLDLGPLDAAGTEQVVARCLGTEIPPMDVVRFIWTNSEGNPFLIEELLAGLVASDALRLSEGCWRTTGNLVPAIPFDFAESMRRRLASFDATGRTVLRAAALLGRRFDWELLPGIAEVDGRAVVEALRLAVDEQVVEVDGEIFRFRHALTREAVLAELLPPERRALAQRALAAIERAYPGLPGLWCEIAAGLAADAGMRSAAGKLLIDSAGRALAKGALVSAEQTARHARTLVEDPDDVDDADGILAQILTMAGRPAEAVGIGEALLARLEQNDRDATRRANILVVLARAAVTSGDTSRAQALVLAAEDLVSVLDDSLAARVQAVAAHAALEIGLIDEARALARCAMECAQRTDQPEVECEALEVLGRSERYDGDPHDLTSFRRAAALAARHGLAVWEVRARHEMALMSAYLHGELRPLAEVRELAAQHGALVSVAVMDLVLAELALGTYDRDLCLRSAHRCVTASSRYALATLPVANLWLAGGHALAGDTAAMEAACREALAPDPDDPRILGDMWGRVHATSAIVRDDLVQLRHDLDKMMTYVRVAPVTTSIFPNRVLWGLLHVIDDDDLGAAAIAELESAADVHPWPIFTTGLEMVRAVALGRQGRPEAANDAYAAAAPRPTGVDEGWLRYSEVLVAGAAIRDGWGDPVTLLRPAEAFFATRGYDRIVRRCRTLLGAAGAPIPRRGRGQAEVPEDLRALGITSRELDVLTLAAEGLSNRQISERLLLSPRTVERHMSSLFARTGRRTRTELRDLLPNCVSPRP